MSLRIRRSNLSECHIQCVFERLLLALRLEDWTGAHLVFKELLKRETFDPSIHISVQENGYLITTQFGTVLFPLTVIS